MSVLDLVTDLDVCFKSGLSFHSHITIINTRDFQRIALIFEGFVSRDTYSNLGLHYQCQTASGILYSDLNTSLEN